MTRSRLLLFDMVRRPPRRVPLQRTAFYIPPVPPLARADAAGPNRRHPHHPQLANLIRQEPCRD